MRIFIFENGIENAPKEYSQYLIYPYSYERCHDESLAAASVVLKNTRREDTFAPGTFVFIGDGDYTSDNMDQWILVSPSRITNHATKRYTHTLYLCDPTKMLERYVLGNKTFTRSKIKEELAAAKNVIPIVEDSNVDPEVSGKEIFDINTDLQVLSPVYEKPVVVPAFQSVFPNVTADNSSFSAESILIEIDNKLYRRYIYNFDVGAYYIDENGNETSEDVEFNEWRLRLYGANLQSFGSIVKIVYTFNDFNEENERKVTYYVSAFDPAAPVKGNITLLQACQIAADVAQTENESIVPMFTVRSDGDIAEREMAQEITDIDLSNATLREAIDSIAGVANCFGRYKLEYNAESGAFEHYIDLYPIHSNEYADVSPLGFPVLQKMNDSIEGACSALDSQASNLINMSDGGTISEPTDNAYISLRSETVRITEQNCLIPTVHPIYKFVGLAVVYEDGESRYEADISQYVYEDTEYNMLSSFDPVYPNSKAYALKYKRGSQNITELSFVQDNALSDLLKRASIVNICNAEFGTNFSGIGIEDGMLKYPNLSFRITYIPVINMRIRQAKPLISDHTARNIICYNQSAQSVDSVRYGRNLAGMADRTGQAEKTIVYKCRKDAALPKAGQHFDDEYVITKISVEELPNYQTVQLGLSRYFNRLNPFIGIDSELRLFEISENNYVDRNVIYEDYCIISDKVHTPNQTPLITVSGLSGFLNSVIGATASGMHLPQLAIAQGYSELEGELNKVALPVTAFGLGRSIVFSFGYQDNYSAGDRSIVPGDYGEMYRLKQAVPYADNFGEIDKLKVALVSRTRTSQLIPNDLPLETSGADFVPLFDTGDDKRLKICKDSRECIQVTYQINFVTDQNWIISPAFAEDLKMVTRRSDIASQSIHVYALTYRLSASDTRIDLGKATKQVYNDSATGERNFCMEVDAESYAVAQEPQIFGEEADKQIFTSNGKAWAVAYDDGRLLFGCNQDIAAGATLLPNINFTFTHKL